MGSVLTSRDMALVTCACRAALNQPSGSLNTWSATRSIIVSHTSYTLVR